MLIFQPQRLLLIKGYTGCTLALGSQRVAKSLFSALKLVLTYLLLIILFCICDTIFT